MCSVQSCAVSQFGTSGVPKTKATSSRLFRTSAMLDRGAFQDLHRHFRVTIDSDHFTKKTGSHDDRMPIFRRPIAPRPAADAVLMHCRAAEARRAPDQESGHQRR
jgi:hypothetical protein